MHVDEKDDLTWTCEAFGIPDVLYEWLKDGRVLKTNGSDLAPEDRGRYEIRDNILIIRQVKDTCSFLDSEKKAFEFFSGPARSR